jgi:hypothetical protein
LARRPRPGPDSFRGPGGPAGEPTPLASTPHPSRWPGWQHYRTPCVRGRPSPTRGHARPRRDRHCRVPTQLSGGPDHQQRGDHKVVAALLIGRARPQAREARRASRNETTPSAVLQPSRRHTAARNARNDSSRTDGDSTSATNRPAERVSDRPMRGAHRDRAKPANSRPPERQPATCPSTSKACILPSLDTFGRQCSSCNAALSALPGGSAVPEGLDDELGQLRGLVVPVP